MSLFKTYRRALSYLLLEKYTFFLICFANICLASITIAEPILFGSVIDAISEKNGIWITIGLWVGFGILNIFSYILVARGADRLTHRCRLSVMNNSFEQIIAMPLCWHQKRGTSSTLHTLIRATDSLTALWLEFMRQHLSTCVTLVLLIPVAISIEKRLFVVLAVLGTIYIMIARLIMHKTKNGQQAIEHHHHKLFEHIFDAISNVTIVQGYNHLQQETQLLRKKTKRLLKAQYPVLNWWAVASGLTRMSSTISMVIILILGGYLVLYEELHVGDIVAFISFSQLMIGRLDQLSNFMNLAISSRAKLEEFFIIEDSVNLSIEPDNLPYLQNVKGSIQFQHVFFKFEDSKQGIYDISFTVEPGQTVAIVGPTGSGKTTLVNLLQRIYKPNFGTISIDGVNINSISRESLSKCFATVFQDTKLFNRTISANICIGKSDARPRQIYEAAKAAAAHEFIINKSHGYNTEVGERGSHLSGGERQRLAIARAILKNAPILILDEATSALDLETEACIKKTLDIISKDHTTLIIAHRLSTICNADLILFIEHGRLIEKGSFAELATMGGRFSALLRAGELILDNDQKHIDNVMSFPQKKTLSL